MNIHSLSTVHTYKTVKCRREDRREWGDYISYMILIFFSEIYHKSVRWRACFNGFFSRNTPPPGCGGLSAPCNCRQCPPWSPPPWSSRPLSCWDQSVLISRQSFHHGKVTWSPRASAMWAGGRRRSTWPSVSPTASVGARRRTAARMVSQHSHPSLTKPPLLKHCE